MKIEQLLVQHFYEAKEVTLQGMGTFTLSPDFVAPKENDKDAEIPDNAISFQYNPKAVEDAALINFIVAQSRKMKSLAAADLDSYLVLGKQFLNIGKPFKIEGMGILTKNQQGNLEFTKGNSFNAKAQASTAVHAVKEKAINPEISFATEGKPKEGSRKGLMIAALVVVVGLIGATTWYFFTKKNNNDNTTVAAAPAVTTEDTLKTNLVSPDTVSTKPPVLEKPAVINNGYTFKVVFLVTSDSAKAAYRMNALTKRGHEVIMYKADSALYKLAEPFKRPLTDTAYIKDSLNRYYYAGKGRIELQ